jgi:hypothetical protein
MSCTLACFEAFLEQNGRHITQRDIILQHPQYCQGEQQIPGWVSVDNYAALASLLGFQCTPLNPIPALRLPHYPNEAVLIGAGNFNGQHSLLLIRALPGNRGIAIDPDPKLNPNPTIDRGLKIYPVREARNYLRFDLIQLSGWSCSFWLLHV